jgi:hypothetical protein
MFFDTGLQPIAEAGAGLVRTDWSENVLGHRSGLNVAANQGAFNITPIYSVIGTVPIKPTFNDEENRANPNQF